MNEDKRIALIRAFKRIDALADQMRQCAKLEPDCKESVQGDLADMRALEGLIHWNLDQCNDLLDEIFGADVVREA